MSVSLLKKPSNTVAVGWVKRSGPTNLAGIGGSVAALLDPPEVALDYFLLARQSAAPSKAATMRV